jgi:hypothetical protein
MNQNDYDEFDETIVAVGEQYGKSLSEGVKMLYWQGLINYDLKAVQQALYRHIRNPDNGQFMPKVADIIRMLQGSTQDSALIAWAKVDKAVRSVGTQVTVVFDDPIIHRVLQDMGGWLALGSKQETEWPFIAKEFENRYRGYKAKNEKVDYPKKLTGLYDATNLTQGFKDQPVILIGDKSKAEQVLLTGNDKPLLEFNSFDDVISERKLLKND